MLVFDSEIPVCFLSHPPHFIAFLISKIKRRLKWPTCWWRHSEPLCVLDTLSERYNSLPFRHCWIDFFGGAFGSVSFSSSYNFAFRFLLYEVRIPKLFLWRCGRRTSFSLFSLWLDLCHFTSICLLSHLFCRRDYRIFGQAFCRNIHETTGLRGVISFFAQNIMFHCCKLSFKNSIAFSSRISNDLWPQGNKMQVIFLPIYNNCRVAKTNFLTCIIWTYALEKDWLK